MENQVCCSAAVCLVGVLHTRKRHSLSLSAIGLTLFALASPALSAPEWTTFPDGPVCTGPSGTRDLSGEGLRFDPSRSQEPALEASTATPQPEDTSLLTVGRYRFDPTGGAPRFPATLSASSDWATDADEMPVRPIVLRLSGPVRPQWLTQLRLSGIQPVQYLAHWGYLALARQTGMTSLGSLPFVTWSEPFHGAFKTDAELESLLEEDRRVTLGIVFFDLPSTQQRIDALIREGAIPVHSSTAPATSQWTSLRYFVFENFPTRSLTAVLDAPEVYSAYVWHPPAAEGERAAQIVAGNIVSNHPVTGYHAWLATLGADGTGVTMCVADTGLDTGNPATVHVDVRGRVSYSPLCANNQDTDGHGTNTTSIAAGDPRAANGGTGALDSGGFYWGGGQAPRASIWSQTVIGACTFNADANTMAQDAVKNGGAKIGSHSFTDGLGGGTSYNSQAAAWDARVRDADTTTAGNQPYAVVFSAGNSGPSTGTLTSPKAAKNIITVGATENDRPGECPGTLSGCGGEADDINSIISFSSRGPTSDSRIKPDVSAPGHVIAGMQSSVASYDCACAGGGGCCQTNADGSNRYTRYSGTSQACPRVAGASGIVFDWFNNVYPAFPSPAMNKAILINGATDIGAADVPNNNEGWGRVNLKTSLMPGTGAFRKDQDSVITDTGSGGEYATVMSVSNPALPVKATLVWTDPPGAVSCNPCLVNDLNLVIESGATTYRGNNFTGGSSTAGGVADTRNNVEGIILPAGTLSGTFTLRVTAAALNGDGVPGTGDSTDQDFALVVWNAIDCIPPAAPTGLTAIGNGNNRIDLAWSNSVPGATEYRVYRSLTPGGPYQLVGSVAPPTHAFVDTPVSGQITYDYVVRAFQSCESSNSNEASASTTGACTLAPAFAGLSSASNAANGTCTLNLSWSAGAAWCSGPLTYSVYRSTASGFTPGPGNRIATGVSSTSYQDLDQLTNNTTYSYVVRAVDTSNSAEETNVVERNGRPTGPITTGNLTETFEGAGGFDNAGWTHQAVSGSVDWVWSTAQSQTPTHSWFSASQTSVSDRVMVSPSFGVLSNTTLSFWHTYAFEGSSSCFDAGTIEISTNGGGSWTVIPDANFTAGGFNGTVSTSYSNPIGGLRAWCFGTIGAMTQVSVNLGSFAGQTVLVRWHAGDDSSQSVTGWYIDSVAISNAGTASVCSAGSNCANNPSLVDVTPDGPQTLCAGTPQLLTATPTGGAGVTYQWYDGVNAIGGATSNTYSANAAGAHSYNCQVKGAGCSSAMSDAAPTSITWQAQPTFAGLAGITNPQQSTCRLDLTWSAASTPCPGGVTYNVYRSTTPGFVPSPGNRIASGITGTTYQDTNGLVSGTTYSYKTRAVTVANGIEDTNTIERSGSPAGPGSGTTTWNSTDVPRTILDNTTVTSTLPITGASALTDVNVRIGSLTHTFDGDLDIFLIAPDGTRVELTTDNGSSGDNFTNTVFDDSAATAITSGTAPFTGSFRPEGSLATLNGKSGNGTWVLEVSDDASQDTGTLNSWSLIQTTQSACTTGAAAPPPVKESGAGAVTFAKGSGDTLNVTYDTAACTGQKVIILSNAIGAWTGYSACALANGGNSGSTSFSSPGPVSTWYNVVWTQGTTAGHPGFSSSGARTWNVGTLCGMTTDDHSHSTCP